MANFQTKIPKWENFGRWQIFKAKSQNSENFGRWQIFKAKSQNWKLLEGLAMEDVGIFYGHLVYFHPFW
jgi:hypothetical protein